MQRQSHRLRHVEQEFVGRQAALSALSALLQPEGPGVTHIYGIAGIGKSRLMSVFAERARSEGATIVRLDCRTVEPTTEGFLGELGEALGTQTGDVKQACQRLSKLGDRVLLVLDTYEVFRLMDTWLRQTLLPALPDNVRLLCLGRERPLAAWRTIHGEKVQVMALEPLDDTEATRLLTGAGVPARAAAHIVRATHGHPLALQLAASAYAERPDLAFEELSLQQALEALTDMFLADVKDPVTRRALEACSVIRRVTVSLLRALLPDLAPRDAYDRLHNLPFVEAADDGLLIHDAVREAMARSLRARDPCVFVEHQKAAWQQLVAETRNTRRSELWRYTADQLYLIENPVVREAFFPSGTHSLAVEPADNDDTEAILATIHYGEGPSAAAQMERWWLRRPDTFAVARGPEGKVSGFCCKFMSDQMEPGWLQDDPITAQWCRHLTAHPLPENQRALFCRRWLSTKDGEAPSPVQAALWLDLKRTYMELRPKLRRVYLTVQNLAAYAPVATRLGFEVLEDSQQELDGNSYHSAVLDFGPESVGGWLAKLAAEELGIEGESLLDTRARELLIDGNWVALTPLEFGVINYLNDHEGQAVSRIDLLRHVWDTHYYGGSNVVDTVVRSLRRKLGRHARRIETVTGVGYRYRQAP